MRPGGGDERGHGYLRELGAVPVTYGAGLVERVRGVAPAPITTVLACIGGDVIPDSIELAGGPERVGTIADHGAVGRYGVRRPGGERSAAKLADLVGLHTAGRLQLPIQAALALDRAAEAHRAVETGHVRGKVVLVHEDDDRPPSARIERRHHVAHPLDGQVESSGRGGATAAVGAVPSSSSTSWASR